MVANLRAVVEVEVIRGVCRGAFAVIEITRYYPLYGLLCGVRTEATGCAPVVPPRGLPVDVEDETVEKISKQSMESGFVSHLFLADLIAVQKKCRAKTGQANHELAAIIAMMRVFQKSDLLQPRLIVWPTSV